MISAPLPRSAVARSAAGFGLLVLAVVAWAGYLAVSVATDMQQTQDDLSRAMAADLEPDEVRQVVDGAQLRLAAARDDVGAPAFRLVAAVPVLGRSLAAERAVVTTSAAVVDAMAVVLQRGSELRSAGGAIDVDSLDTLADELRARSEVAEVALEDLQEVPLSFVPPRVSAAVEQAEAALAPVVRGMEQGAVGAELAAGLLGADGPRNVLVALQNNAELRGTGGYVSTFATGVLQEGRVDLQPFRDVLSVNDLPEDARKVSAPDFFSESYGAYLADTTHWRNWTMSADIPVSASVGAAAAGVLLGTTPDVVVLLDVPAMEAIVGLSGQDVTLADGTVLPSAELTEQLLVEEYVRGEEREGGQDARRAALRSAATTAVRSLLVQETPLFATLRTLDRLAAGRHLAVWSARPEEQERLTALGLSGAVEPGDDDLVLASTNNLNGTKLDVYVDRTVSVDVTLGAEEAQVVQRLTLRNEAPAGLAGYVEGFDRSGVLKSLVELSAGPDAEVDAFTIDGQQAQGFARQGEDRVVVSSTVDIRRSQTVVAELTYTIPTPGGVYRAHLVPQPLAEDARLELRIEGTGNQGLTAIEGVIVDATGRVQDSGTWSEQRVVAVRLADG